MELVYISAEVRDQAGRHIAGLKKEDFTVLQDGQREQIADLRELSPSSLDVDTQSGEGGSTRWVQGRKRLIIVLWGDVTLPSWGSLPMRGEILRYTKSVAERGDLVALFTIGSSGLRVLHHPFADPKLLISALEIVQREMGKPKDLRKTEHQHLDLNDPVQAEAARLLAFAEDTEGSKALALDGRLSVTLQCFQQIAQALVGIPGRKSVFWMTGEIPFPTDETTFQGFSFDRQQHVLYEQTLELLNQAGTTVYPVLVGDSPTPDSQLFASMTAARSLRSGSNLGPTLDLLSTEQSPYYVIAYRLPASNDSKGWPKLKVQVSTSKSHVLAPGRTYLLTTNERESGRALITELASLSPLDFTGLPVSLKWTGQNEAGTQKKKVGFEVVVPPTGLILRDHDPRVDIAFRFLARGVDGTIADGFSHNIAGMLKAESIARLSKEGLHYDSAFELPPGGYTVRIVVQDNLSARIGSFSAYVKVY